MRQASDLRHKIKSGRTIDLSSDFTTGATVLAAILVFVAGFYIIPKFLNPEGFKTNMLLAGLMFIIITVLMLYQLFFAVVATLNGKKLTMKRVLGATYIIDVNQVENIRSFKTRSTKYTHLTFTDKDGNKEKALIISSNSILFGRQISAGDVIKEAQGLDDSIDD